ncbi:MAG: SCO family protein [Pseudomonadota bacterium]
MQRTLLIGFILILASVLVWVSILWEPAQDPELCEQVPALAEAPVGGGFTLHSYRGPVELGDFRNKIVLLYFGYTWCPDICPTNLGLTSLALDELTPDERERVQSLFVSVDPERDTVERLKEYGEYFHPKILGITGSAAEVAKVANLYGAAYRKVEQASEVGYAVDHSADTYLINRRGELVEVLPHGSPPEQVVRLIRKHLN